MITSPSPTKVYEQYDRRPLAWELTETRTPHRTTLPQPQTAAGGTARYTSTASYDILRGLRDTHPDSASYNHIRGPRVAPDGSIRGVGPQYAAWEPVPATGSKLPVRTLPPQSRSFPAIGSTRVALRDPAGTAIGRWQVVRTSTAYKFGRTGLGGSALISGVLAGVGKWAEDRERYPCLSPHERMLRILPEVGYGIGTGALAAGVGMFAAFFGATPLMVGVATIAAGIVLSEFVLPPIRERIRLYNTPGNQ